MILLRIFLISLIIYLLVRSFARYFQADEEIHDHHSRENKPVKGKKISPEIGEYIDYEEVNEKRG